MILVAQFEFVALVIDAAKNHEFLWTPSNSLALLTALTVLFALETLVVEFRILPGTPWKLLVILVAQFEFVALVTGTAKSRKFLWTPLNLLALLTVPVALFALETLAVEFRILPGTP